MAAGVDVAVGREGHLGNTRPISPTGKDDGSADGVEDHFLNEEGLEVLLTAASALAICLRSPVSC